MKEKKILAYPWTRKSYFWIWMQQCDCFRFSTTTHTFDEPLEGLTRPKNSYTQSNVYHRKKVTQQDQQGEKNASSGGC